MRSCIWEYHIIFFNCAFSHIPMALVEFIQIRLQRCANDNIWTITIYISYWQVVISIREHRIRLRKILSINEIDSLQSWCTASNPYTQINTTVSLLITEKQIVSISIAWNLDRNICRWLDFYYSGLIKIVFVFYNTCRHSILGVWLITIALYSTHIN